MYGGVLGVPPRVLQQVWKSVSRMDPAGQACCQTVHRLWLVSMAQIKYTAHWYTQYLALKHLVQNAASLFQYACDKELSVVTVPPAMGSCLTERFVSWKTEAVTFSEQSGFHHVLSDIFLAKVGLPGN